MDFGLSLIRGVFRAHGHESTPCLRVEAEDDTTHQRATDTQEDLPTTLLVAEEEREAELVQPMGGLLALVEDPFDGLVLLGAHDAGARLDREPLVPDPLRDFFPDPGPLSFEIALVRPVGGDFCFRCHGHTPLSLDGTTGNPISILRFCQES